MTNQFEGLGDRLNEVASTARKASMPKGVVLIERAPAIKQRIDEISRDLKDRYASKAAKDEVGSIQYVPSILKRLKKARDNGMDVQTAMYKHRLDRESRNIHNRHAGIRRAVKEDTLPLEELSKGLKARYIRRAADDIETSTRFSGEFRHDARDADNRGNKQRGEHLRHIADLEDKGVSNRQKGIRRAVKEDTLPLEELSKGLKARCIRHNQAHSVRESLLTEISLNSKRKYAAAASDRLVSMQKKDNSWDTKDVQDRNVKDRSKHYRGIARAMKRKPTED